MEQLKVGSKAKWKRDRFFSVAGTIFCLISLFELILFLVLFFSLVVLIVALTVGGLFVLGLSYSLFMLSAILFYIFLSTQKRNRFVLFACIGIFVLAVAVKADLIFKENRINSKYLNVENIQSMKNQSNVDDAHFFSDHFDGDIEENWNFQNFSFPENGCEMGKSQVQLNHSSLLLTVDNNQSSGKSFLGGEVGSKASFLYGTFTVRMKNKIVPGTVSSFFLMNEWTTAPWEHKEIDIEFLGKNLNAVQFTVHHFQEGGKKHVFKEYTHNLEFDSSLDFHDYAICWTPDSIVFGVDGKWVHSEKEILIHERMNIRMNHWAADPNEKNSDVRNWLGNLDVQNLPSRVYYDYVIFDPLK